MLCPWRVETTLEHFELQKQLGRAMSVINPTSGFYFPPSASDCEIVRLYCSLRLPSYIQLDTIGFSPTVRLRSLKWKLPRLLKSPSSSRKNIWKNWGSLWQTKEEASRVVSKNSDFQWYGHCTKFIEWNIRAVKHAGFLSTTSIWPAFSVSFSYIEYSRWKYRRWKCSGSVCELWSSTKCGKRRKHGKWRPYTEGDRRKS